MVGHEHSSQGSGQPAGFRRSPAGLAFAVFLVIVAVLLIYEHRVHLSAGGFGSVLLLVGALAAHGLMHRGHGGHGGHRRPDKAHKPSGKDARR